MNLTFELRHAALGTRVVEPPANWTQTAINLQRNPDGELCAHGIIAETVEALVLGPAARAFLEQVLQQQGTDAVVQLTVTNAMPDGPAVLLDLELDLRTLQLNTGITAICNAVTGGAARQLVQRWAIPVDVISSQTLGGAPLQYDQANNPQPLLLQPVLPSADITPLQTNALRAHDALNRAALVLSNNQVALRSSYLGRSTGSPHAFSEDGPAAHVLLLHGLQARGQNAPVYVALQQALNDLGCIFGLGYGIETVAGAAALRVEPIRYFYDDATEAVALFAAEAVAAGLRLRPNPDLLFDAVDVGYDDAPVAYGQDEFNTARTYRISNQQTTGKLNLRSKLVASGRRLDALRVAGSAAQSLPDDDALFVVHARPQAMPNGTTQYVAVQGVDGGTGLADAGSVLNWWLSPWAMMVRWWQWWGCGAATLQSVARLAGGSGNTFAQGSLSSRSGRVRNQPFAEPTALHREDDALQNLAAYRNANGHAYLQPFLSPWVLSGHAPCTWEQYRSLRDNPYGIVRVQVAGGDAGNPVKTYRGFLRSFRFWPVAGRAAWELALAREA